MNGLSGVSCCVTSCLYCFDLHSLGRDILNSRVPAEIVFDTQGKCILRSDAIDLEVRKKKKKSQPTAGPSKQSHPPPSPSHSRIRKKKEREVESSNEEEQVAKRRRLDDSLEGMQFTLSVFG